MTMNTGDFFKQHKALFHELLDVMYDPEHKVMEWFKNRTDNEVIALAFFAAQLRDITSLLGLTLLLEVESRHLDLDKIRAPEALAPS